VSDKIELDWQKEIPLRPSLRRMPGYHAAGVQSPPRATAHRGAGTGERVLEKRDHTGNRTRVGDDAGCAGGHFAAEKKRITREQAVRWCRERGYGFVELYDGWITYTYKGGIRRERID